MAMVDTETLVDVQRYFEGAIIGVPWNGRIEPHMVLGINPDSPQGPESVATRTYTPPAVQRNIQWGVFNTDCVLTVPPLGSVEQGGHVVYLGRGAERQWERGLRPQLLRFTSLSGAQAPLWPVLCDNLYNRTFRTLAQATADLYEGRAVGRSLHQLWSLISRPNVKVNLLLYKTSVVGLGGEDARVTLFNRFKNLEPIALHTLTKEVDVQAS